MSRPEHFLNPWQRPDQFVRATNDRPLRLSDVINTGSPNRPQTMAEVMRQMKSTLSTAKDWTIGRPEEVITRAGESDQINTPFGSITYPAGSVDAVSMFPFGRGMEMFRGALRTTKPYFSQLRRTLEERLPERAPADQIWNLARKGSKTDELEWSGLENWLIYKDTEMSAAGRALPGFESLNKSGIPKKDVLNWLDKNAPELAEKWAVGVKHPYLNDLFDERKALHSIPESDLNFDQRARLAEIRKITDELVYPGWEQYSTPGGKNYRELAVTLPRNKFSDIRVNAPDAHRYGFEDMNKNRLFHVRMADFTIDGEKTLLMEEIQSDWIQKGFAEGFMNGQEAHDAMRVQIIDPIIDKLVRVWEDVGYEVGSMDRYNIVARLTGTRKSAGSALKELKNVVTPEEYAQLADFSKKFRGKNFATPDVPFKNAWHELGMRRMVQEAVDGGYDRLAWTTGSMQRQRWNKQLAEKVDTIEYIDGTLVAHKDGNQVFSQYADENEIENLIGAEMTDKLFESPQITKLSPTYKNRVNEFLKTEGYNGPYLENAHDLLVELDKIKGPDAAMAIRNIEEAPKARQLTGTNIDVGDRLFKTLYDQKIKTYMEKLAKKHGGKVDVQYIDNPKTYVDDEGIEVDIDEYVENYLESELQSRQEAVSDMDSEDLQIALEALGYTPDEIEDLSIDQMRDRVFESIDTDDITHNSEAIEQAMERYGLSHQQTEVWSMEITPQMKKAISGEGQALFAVPPVAPLIPRDDDNKKNQPMWSRPTNK